MPSRFLALLLLLLPAAALSAAHTSTDQHASIAAHTSSGMLQARIDQPWHLRLHHLHTGEDIDIVYRVGDTYVPGALDRLDHFLRDHRTNDASAYDPREFDLLHNLLTRLHRPDAVIDIVCGYRTPASNSYLRTRAAVTGVAEHSQHMLARAIDIRIPGVSTRSLRNAALALHAGGVGYYPSSQFVHVDVGPLRQWSFRQ